MTTTDEIALADQLLLEKKIAKKKEEIEKLYQELRKKKAELTEMVLKRDYGVDLKQKMGLKD